MCAQSAESSAASCHLPSAARTLGVNAALQMNSSSLACEPTSGLSMCLLPSCGKLDRPASVIQAVVSLHPSLADRP